MVTRNPCLHPGDIKVLKAVKIDDPRFNNILNCIVFPKKGKIPITNQISGGDLDGDQYFVSWDDKLIPP
jgi:RNA-dependent RNA polymerase